MNPGELQHWLYLLAECYEPDEKYFTKQNLLEVADVYVVLYEAFLAGEDLKKEAMLMDVFPSLEEAEKVVMPLVSVGSFLEEMKDTMECLVRAGVARFDNSWMTQIANPS